MDDNWRSPYFRKPPIRFCSYVFPWFPLKSPFFAPSRYVSHMTGTSTAIGLRLEGFHHDKHEDDILIQAPWEDPQQDPED